MVGHPFTNKVELQKLGLTTIFFSLPFPALEYRFTSRSGGENLLVGMLAFAFVMGFTFVAD